MNNNDIQEMIGAMVDVVEDWLERKGVYIENPEKKELEEGTEAIIYGSDYDVLADGFMDILTVNGLLPAEKTNEFPPARVVQALRQEYPVGCAVELIEMNDPYRKMPPGLKGTVTAVDNAGTVHVNWENGSTLGAAYGADKIRRIYKNTRIEYLYRDECNYKTNNEVVVAGTITEEQIKAILECCESGELFIPEQIGWDLRRDWEVSQYDHCYAEIYAGSFQPTDVPQTSDMNADQVVEAFRKAKDKWDAAKYAPEYV